MQKVTTGMRERERGICDLEWVEKENKFTSGTERCENIKNLYLNKNGGIYFLHNI